MKAIPADRIERLVELVSAACRRAATDNDERAYELWSAVRKELQGAPDVTPVPCIYEARSRANVAHGGASEAWCRTHGFDCPAAPPRALCSHGYCYQDPPCVSPEKCVRAQNAYSYEKIPAQGDGTVYRIRDADDNALGRSYQEGNAKLLVAALNAYVPQLGITDPRPCVHPIGLTTCGYPQHTNCHVGGGGKTPPAGRHVYTPPA